MLARPPKGIYSGLSTFWGPAMISPLLLRAFLIFAVSASAVAQGRSGGGGRTSSGSSGSLNSTTQPLPVPAVAPESSASIAFISGKVVLEDGSELTEPAVIQTICRGRRHSETYTDGRGNFNFRFGDPSQAATASIADATSSN